MEKNGDDYIDIEGFLRGMASQNAEREDNIITEDLRGKVHNNITALKGRCVLECFFHLRLFFLLRFCIWWP